MANTESTMEENYNDHDIHKMIPEMTLDSTSNSQTEENSSPREAVPLHELSISGSDETPSEGNIACEDDISSGSPSPIPDETLDCAETANSRPKVHLGKDISLMMQALNSLQSPEEKIAALCKKYADLLEQHKLTQKQWRWSQRKQSQCNKECEQLQVDLNKALLAKSKMESLARELNKYNKLLKQESYSNALKMDKERELVSAKFEAATVEISDKIDTIANHNSLLERENHRLAAKIESHVKETAEREKAIKAVLEHRDLQEQLFTVKLQKAEKERDVSLEQQKKYMEEAVKSNTLCVSYADHEKELKKQIQYYSEKYLDFQSTLEKSNEIFGNFREEMDRMNKKIKELEKDTAMWRQKYEQNESTVKCVLNEKAKLDQENKQMRSKLGRVTSLSRALQAERNELAKKIREHEKLNKAAVLEKSKVLGSDEYDKSEPQDSDNLTTPKGEIVKQDENSTCEIESTSMSTGKCCPEHIVNLTPTTSKRNSVMKENKKDDHEGDIGCAEESVGIPHGVQDYNTDEEHFVISEEQL